MAEPLDVLRTFAVTRTLFPPTTLDRAIRRLGFVQADPIRAPARAQDLILRHRVDGYRAGDLERRFADLEVEEDFFVNYGFVSRAVWTAMHPRARVAGWPGGRMGRAGAVLEFVRARGPVHPREVDAHFAHGRVTNYWGGSSNATTHLLDKMQYQGLLRVVRRVRGIRIYAAHEHAPLPVEKAAREARLDTLIEVAVGTYAPVPGATLRWLVNRLRYAAPQWRRSLPAALKRAHARLAHTRAAGVDWYWPPTEQPDDHERPATVRLLAPFDPVVWDRKRFELLWGWTYRFEAYTPAKKRQRGYYALPMLWRDRVIGWANASVQDRALNIQLGYAGARPCDRAFTRELEAEIARLRVFLGL